MTPEKPKHIQRRINRAINITAALFVILFLFLAKHISDNNRQTIIPSQGIEEMQDYHQSRVLADYPDQTVRVILFE